MLGCSLGWWVAMDRGGAGTISQLFRTLTVDLFSHNPPISHYSLLTPLTPPLLLSLSFFLALSHTLSLSAPPPIGNVTQRGTWQKASNTLTEEDEHEENACLHKSRRAGCCIHTHIHTQWKRQTLHQHTQSDVRMLNLMHRVRRVTKSKIRNERKGYSTGWFTVGHFRKQSWQPALMDLCCLASSTTLSAH